jgi:TonB family protein
MRWQTRISALIVLLSVSAAHAQTPPTQQELEAKLKSQFLMLRGMWNGGKLAFDAQGNVVGAPEKRLFSLSAVLVKQVTLSENKLTIRGNRSGLQFQYKADNFARSLKVSATPYGGGSVEIIIACDPQHPETLDAAVKKVFSLGIDGELAASAPFYWRGVLQQYLQPNDTPEEPHVPGLMKVGPGVANPILRYAPSPEFPAGARQAGLSGMSLIGLIVDARGLPTGVHVVHPLGMGMDELAIASVLQYRFEPGKYQDRAVPVAINIEVNFQIR